MTMPADAQLRLFSEPTPIRLEPDERDEIAEALSWHDGDAIATIATLLEDCAFLRQELAATQSLLSKGFGRGWVPRMTREA